MDDRIKLQGYGGGHVAIDGLTQEETKYFHNLVLATRWLTVRPGTRAGQVVIGGLSEEDVEAFQGVVHGTQWVSARDGRLVFAPATEEPPSPIEDDGMLPFWRMHHPEDNQVGIQTHLFDREGVHPFSYPSLFIQHVCGYGYTPEKYRQECRKLEDWGFRCMRSRRDRTGRYWEIWYLPGLWSAKNSLEHAMLGEDGKRLEPPRALEAAIDFLKKNTRFGTLDVVVQRLAEVIDD